MNSNTRFNRFTESGIELISVTVQQERIPISCCGRDYTDLCDLWNRPSVECTLENVPTVGYDYGTMFDLDFGQLKLFGVYITSFHIDERCRQIGPDEFEYYFVTVARCNVGNYELHYADSEDSEDDKLSALDMIVQQLRNSR